MGAGAEYSDVHRFSRCASRKRWRSLAGSVARRASLRRIKMMWRPAVE